MWVQGAEDKLDWLSMSGSTDTPNTGPAGDHTTGEGHHYQYSKTLHKYLNEVFRSVHKKMFESVENAPLRPPLVTFPGQH